MTTIPAALLRPGDVFRRMPGLPPSTVASVEHGRSITVRFEDGSRAFFLPTSTITLEETSKNC